MLEGESQFAGRLQSLSRAVARDREGDTICARVALEPRTLDALPALRRVLQAPGMAGG